MEVPPSSRRPVPGPGERTKRSWLLIVALMAAVVVALQLGAQGSWGFHRDEFLYLAMARHVDWGYWSNPPLIGALAWFADNATGTSLFAVRLLPLAASIGTMVLTAAMARDFGGRGAAVLMACVPFLVSPGLLRTGALFQPVAFDILFWTFIAWIVVRYLRTSDDRWLIGLGIAVGMGFLNKYSVVFFVFALFLAVLLSQHRRRLTSRSVLLAVVIAAVLALPNLLWQSSHGWPVFEHIGELSESQLANVRQVDFLLEQLLIHLPVALFWMAGLLWFFRPTGRQYRLIGVMFVVVVLVLLLLRGKSYYTLGAYPMLFAAGGVWLERRGPILRWSVPALALVAGIAISPFSVAYLPVDSMIRYGESFVRATGIDAPLRWETGVRHDLPQDYADMLGWEDLAKITLQAYAEVDDPEGTIVFAENYGEAGAVEYYGRNSGIPEVISFADSYRLWAPDSLPSTMRSFVYVSEDDSLDFDHLFRSSRVVGRVDDEHARERGTTVFLLSGPEPPFFSFYADVAARMKSVLAGSD